MAGYHHGNLREVILAAAATVIARDGVDALSLRAIAKDLGVSHTAFRRHFGSREGVLNALAVQGHRLLGETLRTVQRDGIGLAYVRFALAYPGHFAVMFLRSDDPDLIAARDAGRALLEAGGVTGWATVHGIATLALTRNLRGDPVDVARRALAGAS